MTSSDAKQSLKRKLRKFSRTDVPLENDIQTKFLIGLVGLMSFLLVLSCASTIILNSMTNRWSSGLQNKLTIEVSSETKDGFVLTADKIKKETRKLKKVLQDNPAIKTIRILKDQEIRELIAPWIGKDLTLDGIPLPGLITLELKQTSDETLHTLQKIIKRTSNNAHLETHDDWLKEFLSLINSLRTTALLITLLVLAITTIAITTAMHTRLSLYKKDVELLHLMGASDRYIARQFLPHALVITLKGGTIGSISAIILTLLLTKITNAPMIPSLEISMSWYVALLLSPLFLGLIAVTTSYITLLRTLIKMP